MRIIFCLMVFLFIEKNTMLAQQLSSFVEYGAALHTGDNTPLWQVSNQQGLTSLDNNTYIRGGASYKHQIGKWKFEEALDLDCGSILSVGFEKVFLMQNAFNASVSEVISTYVYKVGLNEGQYSLASAIGLLNSMANFLVLALVNKISKTVSENSLW